jgi:hypothetical protein
MFEPGGCLYAILNAIARPLRWLGRSLFHKPKTQLTRFLFWRV